MLDIESFYTNIRHAEATKCPKKLWWVPQNAFLLNCFRYILENSAFNLDDEVFSQLFM